MKIILTTESTCDLPQEILKKYDIRTIPLKIILGENEYTDGVDVTCEDIYNYVENNSVFPKTAALTEDEYTEFFKKNLADGDALIHFGLSSKISRTCESAMMAAEKLDNVYCVDSLALSTGVSLQILHASDMIKKGMSAEEVYKEALRVAQKIQVSFVIKDLDYLYKGGRCSSLSNFFGKMLKIHPEIIMPGGAMTVGKKYKGAYSAVVDKYLNDKITSCPSVEKARVFITHTKCDPELVSAAVGKVKSYNIFDEVLETTAGCTITSHCGPNTLGVLFITE